MIPHVSKAKEVLHQICARIAKECPQRSKTDRGSLHSTNPI
jgi:hypothetical protein